ncbi:MAG: hypothetical protein EBW49_08500, partial [Betaproteobacteria bacterium]|nr:hypothetical protein [Betaproteobacteria bacterium]
GSQTLDMKVRTFMVGRSVHDRSPSCVTAWNEAAIAKAQYTLAQEFSPISDMRASADYRRKLLQQLLQRAWLEQQGHAVTQLGDLS